MYTILREPDQVGDSTHINSSNHRHRHHHHHLFRRWHMATTRALIKVLFSRTLTHDLQHSLGSIWLGCSRHSSSSYQISSTRMEQCSLVGMVVESPASSSNGSKD